MNPKQIICQGIPPHHPRLWRRVMPDDSPVLTELTERIRQISSLLEQPEPGLVSWKLALSGKMKSLIEWWGNND